MRTLLVILLVLVPLPLAAQADAAALERSVREGTRVRLTLAEDVRLRGRVVRLTADSLLLVGGEGAPLASLQRVEVSRGKGRLQWVGLGMAGGSVAGILITRAEGPEDGDIGGLGHLAEGIANMFAGALVGGVAGYFLAPERWRPVWP